MNEKIIKYKNRIEVKILSIVYLILLFPILVILIIEIIKRGFSELWPYVFMFGMFLLLFLLILFIINRFNIIFNYKEEKIIYTPYFKKTKIYKFEDVEIYYCKSKTTLPNDYDYDFLYNGKRIFKLSSIDFEGQTKVNIDHLKSLFRNEQKYIYELEQEIKKMNIDLFVLTYELDEDIAIAYLPNGITIDLGYLKSETSFYLTVYKAGDWNNQLEVIEVKDINMLKSILLNTINKYYI